MKIIVSQTNIKLGRRYSGCFCPIAKAIKRYIKPTTQIYIGILNGGKLSAGIGFGCNTVRKLPQKAVEFVKRFDDGLPVKSFSFDLSIPKRYLRTKYLRKAA